jgi:prepilin-type N-terminal cleavage/methylation domain-containing protein
MESHRTGFTLIELLIVVAIIAILAAIAVPNFLEAQTRSKVSRVKTDMRSLATAIEAYAVDNNSATAWYMFSPGPQFRVLPFDGVTFGTNPVGNAPPRQRAKETYDPTNGTVSLGAVWRTSTGVGS